MILRRLALKPLIALIVLSLIFPASLAQTANTPTFIDNIASHYRDMNYWQGYNEPFDMDFSHHELLESKPDNYNTTGKTIAYAPSVNVTTGKYDHIVSHFHLVQGQTGYGNGTITLSDGKIIKFFISGYNANFLNYRLTYGLTYQGITATANRENLLALAKPNGAIIDLVKDRVTGEMCLAIYSCFTTDFIGGVAPEAVVIPLDDGVYVTSINFNAVGADFSYDGMNIDVYTVSQTVYNNGYEGILKDSFTSELIDLLKSLPGKLLDLLKMTIYLLGFTLWFADLNNLLLVIVSAESIIVLLALTTSRDIFQAFSKFARYNEQAFNVLQGLASGAIAIFTNLAQFIRSFWPL